jgi:xanthine permease
MQDQGTSKYGLNDIPPMIEALPLSMQHVLIFIVSTIAVPIIIASAVNGVDTSFFIQCAIFTAGVTTIVQAFGLGPIGSRLPIVMGVTFSFVGPSIAIANQWGLGTLFGATILCGVLEAVIGIVLIKHIRKIFPPIVTGAVVMVIGLCLLNVAVDYSAGGTGAAGYGSLQNYAIAFATLVIILIANRLGKGFAKAASVLIGMAIMFVICGLLGLVDFSPVLSAPWLAIPQPLKYGIDFNPVAIFIVLIIYLVSMTEFIGDTTGVAMIAAGREPNEKELQGGIICDGLGSAFSGLFNAIPNVTYSGNIGLVGLTGVASRYIVGIAGIIITLLGFVPKLSTLLSLIPAPVIGGGTLVMFGYIVTAGIRIVKVEPLTERNILILAVSIAVGAGFHYTPNALVNYPFFIPVLINGIPGTAMTAVLLNLLFPKEEKSISMNEIDSESSSV